MFTPDSSGSGALLQRWSASTASQAISTVHGVVFAILCLATAVHRAPAAMRHRPSPHLKADIAAAFRHCNKRASCEFADDPSGQVRLTKTITLKGETR